MKGVMDRRVKATILYATETGRSKSYANVIKNLFDRAFACKVYTKMHTCNAHVTNMYKHALLRSRYTYHREGVVDRQLIITTDV